MMLVTGTTLIRKSHRRLRILLSLGTLALSVFAADPFSPKFKDPSQELIEHLDDGKLKIRDVLVDPKSKTITFPAMFNMDDGIVEYAIVGEIGKVHESMLVTKIKPEDLHVAMLLLGASDKRPKAEERRLPPGQPINLSISWTIEGKRITGKIEDYLVMGPERSPMKRGIWVYSGSRFIDGYFTAKRDASIASIILDIDSLINNPRPGNRNDEYWFIKQKAAPAIDTPVEVLIQITDIYEIPEGLEETPLDQQTGQATYPPQPEAK